MCCFILRPRRPSLSVAWSVRKHRSDNSSQIHNIYRICKPGTEQCDTSTPGVGFQNKNGRCFQSGSMKGTRDQKSKETAFRKQIDPISPWTKKETTVRNQSCASCNKWFNILNRDVNKYGRSEHFVSVHLKRNLNWFHEVRLGFQTQQTSVCVKCFIQAVGLKFIQPKNSIWITLMIKCSECLIEDINSEEFSKGEKLFTTRRLSAGFYMFLFFWGFFFSRPSETHQDPRRLKVMMFGLISQKVSAHSDSYWESQ